MWNGRVTEIWTLVTMSPESFKGGGIWNVVVNINGGLKAIGYGLLVLFFVTGVMKTAGSFTEIKRPEQALKLFLRFALAKAAISHCMDLMLAMFRIAQGAIATVMNSSGLGTTAAAALPDTVRAAVESVNFWESIPLWLVTLLGSLFVWALSIVMILTVYGRFFKIYIATALAPIPLAAFAGEPTANIGRSFLKSYAGFCLQGYVIVLACVIFSAFASEPTVFGSAEGKSAVNIVWLYIGELLFNQLILVGAIKASDRLIHELMGLG